MMNTRFSAEKRGPIGVPPRRRPGFTLIEMLVVMAIIGILATLVLSVTGHASRKAKLQRLQADLAQLETAIENYKSQVGHLPPDNVVNAGARPPRVNPVVNPLYYELVGTVLNPQSETFSTVGGNEGLSGAVIQKFFNRNGFVNSATEPREVQNFLPDLDASQTARVNPNAPVKVLVAPVQGPESGPLVGNPSERKTPWQYVSSNPTNNPAGHYDLWTRVELGNEVRVIGNWQQ